MSTEQDSNAPKATVTLIKGAAQRQREAITASQDNVNEKLRELYDGPIGERIKKLTSVEQVRAWARERGRTDVDDFFGELLMVVHPAFVEIGPELYNRMLHIGVGLTITDTWFGKHLTLTTKVAKQEDKKS